MHPAPELYQVKQAERLRPQAAPPSSAAPRPASDTGDAAGLPPRPPSPARPSVLPVLILLLVPLLLTLGRLSGLSGADRLSEILDLSTLPPPLRAHVHQVLFVPVGALVVVIGRLVLGLRPLGVLSPILLAMALPVTGVLPGVGFVGFTLLLTTVFVRPLLKSRGLPYSARVAALLSCVAIFMLLPLVALRSVSDAAAEFAFSRW